MSKTCSVCIESCHEDNNLRVECHKCRTILCNACVCAHVVSVMETLPVGGEEEESPSIWCPGENCRIDLRVFDTRFASNASAEAVARAKIRRHQWLRTRAFPAVIESSVDDIAITTTTKKCPGRNGTCVARIEKNGGCNHITCTLCQHEFCYQCMQSWVRNHECDSPDSPPQIIVQHGQWRMANPHNYVKQSEHCCEYCCGCNCCDCCCVDGDNDTSQDSMNILLCVLCCCIVLGVFFWFIFTH